MLTNNKTGAKDISNVISSKFERCFYKNRLRSIGKATHIYLNELLPVAADLEHVVHFSNARADPSPTTNIPRHNRNVRHAWHGHTWLSMRMCSHICTKLYIHLLFVGCVCASCWWRWLEVMCDRRSTPHRHKCIATIDDVSWVWRSVLCWRTSETTRAHNPSLRPTVALWYSHPPPHTPNAASDSRSAADTDFILSCAPTTFLNSINTLSFWLWSDPSTRFSPEIRHKCVCVCVRICEVCLRALVRGAVICIRATLSRRECVCRLLFFVACVLHCDMLPGRILDAYVEWMWLIHWNRRNGFGAQCISVQLQRKITRALVGSGRLLQPTA